MWNPKKSIDPNMDQRPVWVPGLRRCGCGSTHNLFPQYRIHGFVWTYSKHPMNPMVHHCPDPSCHVGVIVYISSHMNIPWNSVIVDLFGLLTKLMYHCFDFKSFDPKYQPLFNNPKWKCTTSHSPLFFFMCWFYGWWTQFTVSICFKRSHTKTHKP